MKALKIVVNAFVLRKNALNTHPTRHILERKATRDAPCATTAFVSSA